MNAASKRFTSSGAQGPVFFASVGRGVTGDTGAWAGIGSGGSVASTASSRTTTGDVRSVSYKTQPADSAAPQP